MEEATPYPYFVQHGHFCASRPLEVIAATVTAAIFLFEYLVLFIRKYVPFHDGPFFTMWPKEFIPRSANRETDQMHVALMTLIRCLSLLYCYYQVQTVQRSFSKPVAGITSLFALVSAVVFSTGLVNVLHLQVTELGDVIMFYLLWMDLSKVSQLVRMGMRSSNNFQLNSSIGSMFGRFGPVMTFDCTIKILVISIGFISGVRQLEIFAFLSSLAIIVNYIIFMTMFPASLSMIVEVTRKKPIAVVSNLNTSTAQSTLLLSNAQSQSQPILPTHAQLPLPNSNPNATNSTVQNSNQNKQSQTIVQPPSQATKGSSSALPANCNPSGIGNRTQSGTQLNHQQTQPNQQFSSLLYYNHNHMAHALKIVIAAIFLLLQSYGCVRKLFL